MWEWLYQHVFRGVGILFLVGLLTILYLAASFLAHRTQARRTATPPPSAAHQQLK